MQLDMVHLLLELLHVCKYGALTFTYNYAYKYGIFTITYHSMYVDKIMTTIRYHCEHKDMVCTLCMFLHANSYGKHTIYSDMFLYAHRYGISTFIYHCSNKDSLLLMLHVTVCT